MGGVTFSFIQNSAFIRDVYNIVPDYDKDWFFADDDGEADGECSEGDGDSHEAVSYTHLGKASLPGGRRSSSESSR